MKKHLFGGASLSLLLAGILPSHAQEEPPAEPITTQEQARAAGLESLRNSIRDDGGIPTPSNLSEYVRRLSTARALGKALFHDQAIGSDGIQACVTCHFHAGADSRPTNQVSPGLLRVVDSTEGDVIGFHNAAGAPDETFQTLAPNRTLTHADFPFVRDIGNGDNVIEVNGVLEPAPGNSNDTASSMGILLTEHLGVVEGGLVDLGNPLFDPIFNDNGNSVRRVEPRNTPTVINAVFNFHNFWDGRANHKFNGVNPFGNTDPDAKIFRTSGGGRGSLGTIECESISLDNASLASQAVGPPLSDFEMSFAGRTWPEIGRKVLSRLALQGQEVHAEDSSLRGLRNPSGLGLTLTYGELIERTFWSDLWNANEMIYYPPGGGDPEIVAPGTTAPEDTFTLMEANFALFYGISVMVYEASLVSDRSPFDQWMESGRPFVPGFGPQELAGLDVFVNKGKCANCHGGPELTNASVRNAQQGNNIIEPMLMADLTPAIYDNGYYNIGVTPTSEDLGRGGKGPNDKPLSSSRQWHFEGLGIDNIDFEIIGSPIPNLVPQDEDNEDILGFIEEGTMDFYPVCRDLDGDGLCSPQDEILLTHNNVDGAFKTPGLRNVSLTGPFMHNGSLATLREVVQFYNRGGNFCRTNRDDLDPDIRQLELTEDEEIQLVAFMHSLTDRRVQWKRAPFDTPQFFIPEGHLPDGTTILREIPANGRRGTDTPTIGTFLGLDNLDANPVTGDMDEHGNVKCSPNFPPVD